MPDAKGGIFVTFEPARRAVLEEAATRALLDWEPKQLGLIADIDQQSYFEA